MRDALLIFGSAIDIKGTASTATPGTDVIDLGAVLDHTGTAMKQRMPIKPLYWNCSLHGTDLLAGTDGSIITFQLMSDTDSTPTTGGDVLQTEVITANTPADQLDGELLFSVPLKVDELKGQYVNFLATVSVQTLTTGTIRSWIGEQCQVGQ